MFTVEDEYLNINNGTHSMSLSAYSSRENQRICEFFHKIINDEKCYLILGQGEGYHKKLNYKNNILNVKSGNYNGNSSLIIDISFDIIDRDELHGAIVKFAEIKYDDDTSEEDDGGDSSDEI